MGYEIIKELAKQKGISLESIAKHANISYNSLSKIVRNTIKAPKYSTIRYIAEALDMSIDELSYTIGMTETPPNELQSAINITLDEQNIINQYRMLDSHGKEIIDFLLSKECDRCCGPHTNNK